jgi:hypothetical protein
VYSSPSERRHNPTRRRPHARHQTRHSDVLRVAHHPPEHEDADIPEGAQQCTRAQAGRRVGGGFRRVQQEGEVAPGGDQGGGALLRDGCLVGDVDRAS